jgi:hypothetical protein
MPRQYASFVDRKLGNVGGLYHKKKSLPARAGLSILFGRDINRRTT